MQARENRSDVESELELEDPTEVGDDMIFFEEEESQEVVVTSAERCVPWPHPLAASRRQRGMVMFPHQGSVLRARTPSTNGRRSGRGHRALLRHRRPHPCLLWA